LSLLKAGEGPLGDRVGKGAREVESSEGVKAFDVTDGLSLGAADAGDPDAVAGEVLGVGRVHLFGADLFLRSADATRGFDAGDGRL
jgi:hypothetical protein